ARAFVPGLPSRDPLQLSIAALLCLFCGRGRLLGGRRGRCLTAFLEPGQIMRWTARIVTFLSPILRRFEGDNAGAAVLGPVEGAHPGIDGAKPVAPADQV